ncbi:MAG TPA: YihA family ribosome biogenesis GTP-binding protein [Clostridiales bacterium]|nr:MAG: YihA family ribosome biogenesis GTP-binding protein [Clostridiales bacterium GWD2_32_59]HAN10757.1 YihA family ribosome biogenesis GTP-binding protein [Clostridiales bacterium]
MNIQNVELEMTAGKASQFPVDEIPEIAFAGRSNVGKSSLLNSMINRKSFARTSSAPGKTRTINFYNIDKVIRFVDLPGYGYASASKGIQEGWLKVIDYYLNNRENLKCLALLLDVRREPNNEDKMMFEFLKSLDMPHIIIITKIDKLGRNERNKNIQMIKKTLGVVDEDNVVLFSTIDKIGRDVLWEKINNMLLYL